jgi:hypothetical protein
MLISVRYMQVSIIRDGYRNPLLYFSSPKQKLCPLYQAMSTRACYFLYSIFH